jgi:hypothetical protein
VYDATPTEHIYLAENGDWDTAANWISGSVPGGGETALFDQISGDCTLDASQVVGTLETTADYAGTVTVPSSYSLTPAALTLADAGDLAGNGTLVLQDWAASLPNWTGSLTLEATGSAGDVTITPSGTLDLIDWTLVASGDDDLILDGSGGAVIEISGDWTTSETGTGQVKWHAGSETVDLDGTGSQTIDVNLSVHGSHYVHAIEISNTSTDVTVSQDVWCEMFSSCEGEKPENIEVLDGAEYRIADGIVVQSILAFQAVRQTSPSYEISGNRHVAIALTCNSDYPISHPIFKEI